MDDVKTWIAEHDGRINAFWDEQHRWNTTTDSRLDNFSKRLSVLERRVMWIVGAGAVAGSLAGQFFRITMGS